MPNEESTSRTESLQVIMSRVYEPSREDLDLIEQCRVEASARRIIEIREGRDGGL